MKQLKGVSNHKRAKKSVGKAAILHSCIIVQKSNECYYNAQLCEDSLGEEVAKGVQWNY